MAGAVFPEYKDISKNERNTLWSESIRKSPLVREAETGKNYEELSIMLIVMAIITGGFSLALLNLWFLSLTSTAGISGLFFIFKTLAFERNMKAVRLIYSASWINVFLKNMESVLCNKCEISNELKSMVVILEYARDRQAAAPVLGNDDIIGMIRLSENIRKASAGSAGFTCVIEVSGENSELLGRVAETLTGKTMTEMKLSITSPQKLVI